MLIEVTESHIAAGKRYDCLLCPIALAIKEAFGIDYCSVGTSGIVIKNKIYQTPWELREKFIKYDNTGELESFEIEVTEDEIIFNNPEFNFSNTCG